MYVNTCILQYVCVLLVKVCTQLVDPGTPSHRFRHQVAQLFNESQVSRDWSRTVSNTFSIRVRREHLLQDSLDMLLAVS